MDSSFLLCWIPGTCIHITDLTMTASSLYGLKNEQQIAKTLIAWEIVSRVIGELQLFSHNNEICFYNHLNVCKSFKSPKPRFSVSSNPLIDHPRLCLICYRTKNGVYILRACSNLTYTTCLSGVHSSLQALLKIPLNYRCFATKKSDHTRTTCFNTLQCSFPKFHSITRDSNEEILGNHL